MNFALKKTVCVCLLLATNKSSASVITIDTKEHFKQCLQSKNAMPLSHKEQVNSSIISNIAAAQGPLDSPENTPEIEHFFDEQKTNAEPTDVYKNPVLPPMPPHVEIQQHFTSKPSGFIPTVACTHQPLHTRSGDICAIQTQSADTQNNGFFTTLYTHVKNGALYIQEKFSHEGRQS